MHDARHVIQERIDIVGRSDPGDHQEEHGHQRQPDEQNAIRRRDAGARRRAASLAGG